MSSSPGVGLVEDVRDQIGVFEQGMADIDG
jgi:hypothetical protein